MDHSTRNERDRGGREPAADSDAQDLHATEDSIRSDLRRLTAVEAEKQSLAADDPKVDALSDDAVRLAERILKQTRAEQQLGEELS
jgi:hypothetical protein